jgi:Zn-dependent M28 family amino/carboxypeptidase
MQWHSRWMARPASGLGPYVPMFLRIGIAGVLILITLHWMLLMDTQQKQSYHSSFNSNTTDDLSESELMLRDQLEAHVRILGSEIGERNMWKPSQMAATVDYIKRVWAEQGYDVLEQEYWIDNDPVQNLEIEIMGSRQPEAIVVIGAHYDSVRGSPGANDNGSGVAALLELSRLARSKLYEKTVRFVAFTNEEPPFFLSRKMGSRVYAARARERNEDIQAMLSLETIGYYSDVKGSQNYPFPFGLFYPDTANFIGFVGNLRSRNLVKRSLDLFRSHTRFPAYGVVAPEWMTGIGWSDQWSFWREGYPAIMVTDTALYRYDYYHTMADTPDKLVYDQMALAVAGLSRLIEELCGPLYEDR